jgi:hypothetical protein
MRLTYVCQKNGAKEKDHYLFCTQAWIAILFQQRLRQLRREGNAATAL